MPWGHSCPTSSLCGSKFPFSLPFFPSSPNTPSSDPVGERVVSPKSKDGPKGTDRLGRERRAERERASERAREVDESETTMK